MADRDIDKDIAQAWLTRWFASRGKIKPQASQVLLDTDYFEAGWMTSMEVVEFVTEIEEHFGVQFSDQEMQDPRFASIAGLASLILQGLPQANGKG